jgi:hypothetical protein
MIGYPSKEACRDDLLRQANDPTAITCILLVPLVPVIPGIPWGIGGGFFGQLVVANEWCGGCFEYL